MNSNTVLEFLLLMNKAFRIGYFSLATKISPHIAELASKNVEVS